jgi:hypothetical protein
MKLKILFVLGVLVAMIFAGCTESEVKTTTPVLHVGDVVEFEGIKFTFVDAEYIGYGNNEYYLRLIYGIENTLDEKIPYYSIGTQYAIIDGQQVESIELIGGDEISDLKDFNGIVILPHAKIIDSVYIPIPAPGKWENTKLYLNTSNWGLDLMGEINKSLGQPYPKTVWENIPEIVFEVNITDLM